MEEKTFLLQGMGAYNHSFHITEGELTLPRNGQKPITITVEQKAELEKNKTFADMIEGKELRFLDYMPNKFKTADHEAAEAKAKAKDAEKAKRAAELALKEKADEAEELKAKLEKFEGTIEVAEKIKEKDAEIEELKAKLAAVEALKKPKKDEA
jgi:chromosome segregation ATPase